MFGGLGGALKSLSGKAEEMIEKTKTSVGEMAAEKKAAAAAMLEAQAKKTGDVLWQSKSNLESTAVDTVTEGKQAAIDGFDKEIEKVEKAVEEGVTETKEETKPVENTPSEPEPSPSPSMIDPTKLLGSLDISGGIGTVEKEVEKTIDNAIHEVNTVVDTKMKEADELIDHKREEVVKTVQEEVSKATGSSAEGFGAVLGKAKGLLNF
ncbi:uncharacterized protein [Halyomorpha halys]|uniref:uncharacterized protein n=1 Tax=Halyomorpha halys TaxID=286706 RepID=UPI0006D4F746|nr:uncharacterized protein LOC106687221 [Halyomorpha halys]